MTTKKTKTENELMRSLTESSRAFASAMILSMIIGMVIKTVAK